MGPESGPLRNNIRSKLRKQEVKANALRRLSEVLACQDIPFL